MVTRRKIRRRKEKRLKRNAQIILNLLIDQIMPTMIEDGMELLTVGRSYVNWETEIEKIEKRLT